MLIIPWVLGGPKKFDPAGRRGALVIPQFYLDVQHQKGKFNGPDGDIRPQFVRPTPYNQPGYDQSAQEAPPNDKHDDFVSSAQTSSKT
jgi:hypothetical protein